jgi:hypothetical protein
MLLESMGVMTMKMISRTSITSTMGVTLMSETTFPAFKNLEAIYFFLRYSSTQPFEPDRSAPSSGALHRS